MRANSWLYHYYMVQSRLQYNLAYGGQVCTTTTKSQNPIQVIGQSACSCLQPASIAAALYPQMMQHMMQSSGPTSPGGTPTGPPPPPGQPMSKICLFSMVA